MLAEFVGGTRRTTGRTQFSRRILQQNHLKFVISAGLRVFLEALFGIDSGLVYKIDKRVSRKFVGAANANPLGRWYCVKRKNSMGVGAFIAF